MWGTHLQQLESKHPPFPEPGNDEFETAPEGEGEATGIAPAYRPVTIVDASEPKKLDLRVEVPVEDMAVPVGG